MDNSGELKENTQPAKEQRIQSMLDLSKKYTSALNIPEEELSNIGYVRKVMEDGTVRLIPRERVLEVVQKDKDWEKSLKTRERPFEQISIEITTAGQNYRFIPRTQRRILGDKLFEVECAFYPNWQDGASILGELDKIDSRIHNLRNFYMDFWNYLKKQVRSDWSDYEELILKNIFFELLPVRRKSPNQDQPVDQNDFLAIDFRKRYSELDGSVKSVESKQMHEELARLGGYFCDIPELKKEFKGMFEYPIPVSDEERKDYPRLIKFLEEHRIYTYADFIRSLFPPYLEQTGLPEMAAVIKNYVSLEEISNTLSYMDSSDDSKEEESNLKRLLKTSALEEKIKLSNRLKQIELEKKKRKQIRLGVIDYFSSPELYAEICKRKIKGVQDFLTLGKGEEKVNVIYLDATENKELDRDPGKISGDCTIGRPLPFDRTDLPLYNLKVFDNKKNPIGNMYLLVTKLVENQTEGKVWHFDAIQVPGGEVNWKESLGQIMSEMIKQAKLKGVDVITVNSKIQQISNYDYIASAVKEYWEKHGKQMVDIDIPEVEDSEHSSLQGTGTAIVLWSKESLSDPYEDNLDADEDF